MFRLDKVIKPWKESASLNDHINLYGFWNETTFLTKSGDVGMVLSIPGVDYESLDHAEQEYAVKRLEAALKAFGPGFHVYQYLFKSNRPYIPFARYDDPVVEAAIEQRRHFFEGKRDDLYEVEIFYAIVLEGARSKSGIGSAFAQLFRDPAGAFGELRTQFTNNSMKVLLRSQIETELARLDQKVQTFARQLADFMQIEVLNQQGQFRFFRRLLNYDEGRIAGRPQSTQFLDYQVVNSNIEAERDHLRVGDHFVRVLTMKEAITETRPLVLNQLLKIPANFYVGIHDLIVKKLRGLRPSCDPPLIVVEQPAKESELALLAEHFNLHEICKLARECLYLLVQPRKFVLDLCAQQNFHAVVGELRSEFANRSARIAEELGECRADAAL